MDYEMISRIDSYYAMKIREIEAKIAELTAVTDELVNRQYEQKTDAKN